ncbi:MAG: DoxX family protein [Burkholderiales bacterium]
MTSRLPAYGALLLRSSLGVMFIAHSLYLKAVVFTLPGTAQFFSSIGLPAFLAYVVFAMEALGGVALIVGFRTRWVAAALVPVLAGATWAHAGSGWLFTNANGGWEYPLFLTMAAAAQAMLGGGAFAMSREDNTAIHAPAVSRSGILPT